MDYKEFYNLLLNHGMITPIWEYILEMAQQQMEEKYKNEYLVLFTMYFSLLGDGNTCMSLDKAILQKKWSNKLKATKVMLEENGGSVAEAFSRMEEISSISMDTALSSLTEDNLKSVIGKNKMFVIEDGWLYLRKYSVARRGISNSIERLFKNEYPSAISFNYKDCIKESFKLSNGQEKAVINGVTKNLIITGGPGTGKTTSILFLLLGLLSDNSKSYDIHLIAPSGKASSRMKDSIINGLSSVKDEFKKNNPKIIDIIGNLEESTIHRLLSIDFKTSRFNYNKNHQFSSNSVFIIDEASMIDICLFNALLQSIPDTARVFIMGDKNQLPSVECGAVFGDLLKREDLINHGNIVTLDESRRFSENTIIYKLAKEINEGLPLSVCEADWKDYKEFKIEPDDKSKPIFYYYLNPENKKQIIESVTITWAKEYFTDLQDEASNIDASDIEGLSTLFDLTEKSKILCAENEGATGVKMMNQLIKNKCIDKGRKTSIAGEYAGQIMMINTNNKLLDLYNGDSGLLVTLENNDTLYFMVKKKTKLIEEDGVKQDAIFKMGEYIFYPLRLISKSEIDLAYAITIHKSQGSDYSNILVMLPTKKGHPLLNRQIVYTAITRTKGNTYILASQASLEEARDNLLVRDTNVN